MAGAPPRLEPGPVADVTLDVYPYLAASTNISAALMPTWAQEGSRDDILKRLHGGSTRSRILRETMDIIVEGYGGGDPHNVLVSRCDWNRVPPGAPERCPDCRKPMCYVVVRWRE